jgi:bacteriocin-like protein
MSDTEKKEQVDAEEAKKAKEAEAQELSDKDLDNVAGGAKKTKEY